STMAPRVHATKRVQLHPAFRHHDALYGSRAARRKVARTAPNASITTRPSSRDAAMLWAPLLRLPLLVSCAVATACVALAPRSARAEQQKQIPARSPHRIEAGLALFEAKTFFDPDDYYSSDEGGPLALGAAYAYATAGPELQAGVTYLDFINHDQ